MVNYICSTATRTQRLRNGIRSAWRTWFLLGCLSCLGAAQQPDIQNLVASGNLQGMRWPNFSDYRASLQEFYEPTGYAPAWVQGTQPVPQALSLIELFRDAGKKGLDPEAYDASRWEERVRALQGSPVPGGGSFRRGAHRLHHALRVRLAHRTDQSTAFRLRIERAAEEIRPCPVSTRSNHDRSATCHQSWIEIEPPFAGYRRTEQALARYVELARTDDGEKLPAVTKPIDPGQPYAGRTSPGPVSYDSSATCRRTPQSSKQTLRSTVVHWSMPLNTSSSATASMPMGALVPPRSNN